MLLAIEYWHNRGIVHRDVKLENFLMDCDENDGIVVKLSDFGLACRYKLGMPLRQKCGSILAVAPEMISCDTYGHKVDIWGLGVILHELLTTTLPFYHDDDSKFKKNVVNDELMMDDPAIWGHVSK